MLNVMKILIKLRNARLFGNSDISKILLINQLLKKLNRLFDTNPNRSNERRNIYPIKGKR